MPPAKNLAVSNYPKAMHYTSLSTMVFKTMLPSGVLLLQAFRHRTPSRLTLPCVHFSKFTRGKVSEIPCSQLSKCILEPNHNHFLHRQ